MCWTSKTLKKLIAEEDIPVFKVVYIVNYDRVLSIYKNFEYFLDTLYCINTKDPNDSTCFDNVLIDGKEFYVNVGFHSYDPKICTFSRGPYNQGFIASNTTKMLDWGGYGTRVDCIIPKGATYIENEDGEIVSNQIILTRIDDSR